MAKMMRISEDQESNLPMMSEKSANIVDLLLLDHQFLKDCIETLTDEDADRSKIASTGKKFLAVLEKHSKGEKKTIYADLEQRREFHFAIVESEIEHGLVDMKVRMLKPKFAHIHRANDQLAAEIKVVAELVKHHIREEESELLPKVNDLVAEDKLLELGSRFLKIRQFTPEELQDYPMLDTALEGWRLDMLNMSNQFMSRISKAMDSLRSE
jgi:hemerythrin-like domain-containing protein